MLDEGRPERNVVYVISDFRAQPWESPAAIREALQEVDKTETPLHLISAARQRQNNLAIESIRPDGATRAAGVPMFVNIAVRNHGDSSATKVRVTARTVLNDPDAEASSKPGEFAGQLSDPQVEQIDSIPAGGVGVARVQVFLPLPGKHVIQASLPDDAVAADNRRWSVLELQVGEKVLAIEDRPSDRNAYFLETLLRSDSDARTGLQPETKNAAFLRETTLDELRTFSTIYLFGADNLDTRAVENLEQYVREGGGVGHLHGAGSQPGTLQRATAPRRAGPASGGLGARLAAASGDRLRDARRGNRRRNASSVCQHAGHHPAGQTRTLLRAAEGLEGGRPPGCRVVGQAPQRPAAGG